MRSFSAGLLHDDVIWSIIVNQVLNANLRTMSSVKRTMLSSRRDCTLKKLKAPLLTA